MRTLLLWTFCVVFVAPSLATQPWRVDRTQIRAVAQDSTGQVWGMCDAGLCRWEGSTWKSTGVPGFPDLGWAMSFDQGPDGAVYCIWSAGRESHAVTWHKGGISRLLAQITGHLEDYPRIFVDRNGNVWCTEPGRDIFRVSPQGQVDHAYSITDSQLLHYTPSPNLHYNFNPILAAEDARGRVWIWSNCLAGGTNLPSLAGVLVHDGEKFDHHSGFAGVPEKKLSIVASDDAAHMWVAVADDQLYRVDINTFAATPVSDPSPQAFRYVQKIFHDERDTYLISGSVWQPMPERSGGGRSGTLWRWRDGKWEKLVNGLDMHVEYAQHPFRPFLATERGLWVGAFGSGPWLLPADGAKPTLIDWRYDYPLSGSEGLAQLADGRLLMVSANEGSVAVKPADLLGAFESPAEVSTLKPLQPFIQDVRGHILGIIASGDKALSDWDGKTWREHPLPHDFDLLHVYTLAEDSLHRIWLLPDVYAQPKSVLIFDPHQEAIEAHPDYRLALQAQLPHLPGFHLDSSLFNVPSFTKDGRICYRDDWNRVQYFNGGEWREWHPKEIDGKSSIGVDGPAFFDRAGNVAVNIEGKTWEFTDAHGWRTTEYERGLGTDPERARPRSPAAPPGCPFEHPESIVQDRLGTYWLTHGGLLYRAIPGLCLPQFSPHEPQPFINSRTLKEVMIDAQGNTFLETWFQNNPGVREYVIVKARPPLPRTGLHATAEPGGRLRLGFQALSPGAVWFTWRIDGGPWAAPTRQTEAIIEDLPNGSHQIAAAAIDHRLQVDPAPAEAQVEVHVDAKEQITRLIKQLGDPNYSRRNAAVGRLLLQPALALPLLRSAREKAKPEERWWIDATIQQIEESLPTNQYP